MKKPDAIAAAIDRNLSSPNEADRNLEPANVVDAIFFLGRALRHIAESQATCPETGTRIDLVEALYIIGKAGEQIAGAIHDVAAAVRERESAE